MELEYDSYEIVIRMDDRLVGGIPVTEEGNAADIHGRWLAGQKVEDDPSFERPLVDVLGDDPDMPVAEELQTGGLTGFKRDDFGLYVEARQVKAMLREAAQRLGLIKKRKGMRQVLQHDLEVRGPGLGQKIHLDREEPDGVDQRPISVMTPQGPRAAIKRFEYVEGVELRFDIWVLRGGVAWQGNGNKALMDAETLEAVLRFSGFCLGLGADRSQNEGRFALVRMTKVDGWGALEGTREEAEIAA